MTISTWAIACASAQLTDKPFPFTIAGKKLVVFRDSAGRPKALKDRCCHRGMPLSRGHVKGDLLACAFHGWEFDGGGRCVRIPSQGANIPIAKPFCVPAHPCEEQDGYVWIWTGADEPKTPAPIIPDFAATAWRQGAAHVRCATQRALEITFDGSHIYHVHATHPATIAAKRHGFALGASEVRLTETGCVSFSPPAANDDAPMPTSLFSMEFLLPGQIRFGFSGGATAYFMIFHVTPIDDRNCRIDWLIASDSGSKGKAEFVPHSDFLQEDVDILEAIQLSYEAEDEDFERSCEADAAVLFLRKVVRLAAAGKWRGMQSDLPKRRVYAHLGPAAFP